MPPAFTLSQDQTLRFIHHQIPKDPTAPNHPALILSPTISQPSQTTRHQANHPRHQGRNLNTRAPTAHPTPHQQPSNKAASTKAVITVILQPSTQPSKSGQPRTKHFQNRFSCQRTKANPTRDNLREVTIKPFQLNPPSSAGRRTYRVIPASSTPYIVGVGGFYSPPSGMSNGFHHLSCIAFDAWLAPLIS